MATTEDYDMARDTVGPADELEETLSLRVHIPGSCATSGPELVLAGLVKQLHAHTITLEDANIVARLVTNGTSARQQAARLYMSPRVAQRRVQTVATHLLANAVSPGDPVRQVWCHGRLTLGASA